MYITRVLHLLLCYQNIIIIILYVIVGDCQIRFDRNGVKKVHLSASIDLLFVRRTKARRRLCILELSDLSNQ